MIRCKKEKNDKVLNEKNDKVVKIEKVLKIDKG